jgi:hypothetical protein
MGKFQWMQGHHKQLSDKYVPSPEWFSKNTGEPSRQALNDLAREQSDQSDVPSSTNSSSRTRSRAGTMSSILSYHAKSPSERSVDIKSRPESSENVVDDAVNVPANQDAVSRNLFSKGSRIMRRKTSRLTLLPSQLEEVRPLAQDSPKMDRTGQILAFAPRRRSTHLPKK